MRNNLFNTSKLNEMCLTEPTQKQLEIALEWYNLVENNALKGEVENYIKFAFKFLHYLLGYTEDDIIYEKGSGRGRVEFSIKGEDKKIKLVIELKGQNIDLDKPQKRGKKVDLSPVDQAFAYAIENKSVQWIVVSNYDEVRLYNYYKKKDAYISFKAKDLTESEQLKVFLCLLSKDSFIEKSFPDQLLEETVLIEKDFTKEFYKFYHATRLELAYQIKLLHSDYEIDTLVTTTQLILNRIIFIAFAEDWNLIPSESLAKSILSPIRDKDIAEGRFEIWRKLSLLFEDINQGKQDKGIPPYNGGLFKEDLYNIKLHDIIPNDKTQKVAFKHKFDYKEIDKVICDYTNINPIYKNFLKIAEINFRNEASLEILGHIFEQSILDLEKIADEGLETAISVFLKPKRKKKSSRRKKEGIFYTPEMVTSNITRDSIVQYLSNKPNSYTVEELLNEYNENIEELDEKIKPLMVSDIACGSGAFLSQATDIITEISQKVHEIKVEKGFFKNNSLGAFFIPVDYKNDVIVNKLMGFDINANALEIAKLSLFLKVAKKKDKLPSIDQNFICGNSIISDLTIARDGINWEEIPNNSFSVIIINPPYIPTEKLTEEERNYFPTNYSVSGKYETSVIFIERCISLLENGGILGVICPLTWQTGFNYRKFREEIFKDFTLKKIINLPFDIFPDAYVDTGIVIFEKKIPTDNDIYYAYQFEKNVKATTIHVEEWEKIKLKNVFDHPEKKVYCSNAFYTFEKKINNLISENKAVKLGSITTSIQGYHRGKFIRKDTPETDDYIPFYESGTALRHFINTNRISYVDMSDWETLKKFYQKPKIFIRRIINRQDRLMAFYYAENLLTTKDYNPFILDENSEYSEYLSYYYLSSILNSKLISFMFINTSAISLKDDFRQTDLATLRDMPIILPDDSSRAFLEEKAQLLSNKYYEFHKLTIKIIRTLKSKYQVRVIARIASLHNFTDEEVISDFTGLSIQDTEDLLEYFNDKRKIQFDLINQIKLLEEKIDDKIYVLYELTDEEKILIDKRFEFWI